MKPTRDEILNATPAQLREWVAVDVMKLSNVRKAEGGEYMARFDFADEGDLIYDTGNVVGWDTAYVPNYPEDIAAAWPIIEKLEIDPRVILTDVTRASETGTYEGLKWNVRMRAIETHGYWNASAETVPLAICRAALLAMLEKE